MSEQKNFNPVTKSRHYNSGEIECIDAIESMLTGWTDSWLAANAFQVVKYIWRCPFKEENALQDLQKAKYYLEKMIKHLENLYSNNQEDTFFDYDYVDNWDGSCESCKYVELTDNDFPCNVCRNNKVYGTEEYNKAVLFWEKGENNEN